MTDDLEASEFEGHITEAAVAVLRARIGLEERGIRNGNTEVSRDSIVNFAHGTGDLNPLFRDEEYAAKSRWGGIIAAPPFLRYMGDCRPDHGMSAVPAERICPRGDPIAGVHGFYSGAEFFFFRPLRPGDRLHLRGGPSSVEVKQSRMGGLAVHEKVDKVWWDQDGNLVGIARDLLVRIERGAARERKQKYRDDIPKTWTAEEIEQVDRLYEAAEIRGSEPRFWDDVNVGDTSVPMPKGPYTVASFIAFHGGTGLLRGQFLHVHAEWHKARKKHPRGYPVNPLGIPDTVAAVHWDKELAQRAGVPERYDAGAERICWMAQAVTAWMGDDAFLRRLKAEVRGFLYVGDLVTFTCTVIDKYESPAGCAVHLDIIGRTQRDEIVAQGDADVLLPRRTAPVVVPVIHDGQVSIYESGGPDA
jgi:acyl dehydratase